MQRLKSAGQPTTERDGQDGRSARVIDLAELERTPRTAGWHTPHPSQRDSTPPPETPGVASRDRRLRGRVRMLAVVVAVAVAGAATTTAVVNYQRGRAWQQRAAAATTAVGELETELAEARAALGEAEKAVTAAENESEALRETVGELRAKLSRSEADVARLERRLNRVVARQEQARDQAVAAQVGLAPVTPPGGCEGTDLRRAAAEPVRAVGDRSAVSAPAASPPPLLSPLAGVPPAPCVADSPSGVGSPWLAPWP